MLSVAGLLQLLNDKERKLPDFITRWKGVYFGMSLHIDGACPAFYAYRDSQHFWIYPNNYFGLEYQFIFDTFLYNRHPREAELTRQYRLSQHKPFTQTPFLQIIQVVVGAIFQDSGYGITLENKEDNDYIWGQNFHGKNLVGYISHHFKDICSDPNGFFITIPKEPWDKTTTTKIEPEIYFIKSKWVLHWGEDEILFEIPNGYTWAVNKIGLFRFTKENEQYIHVDQNGYYSHMLNRIPIHTAGGIWNSQGFFDSWLTPAKSVADDYIGSKSAKALVDKEASHPIIVEPSTDCPDCTNGELQWCNNCKSISDECRCNDTTTYEGTTMRMGWVIKKCPSCGGTGDKSRNPGERIISPVSDMGTPLIQIHNFDVNINKYHAEDSREIYNALLRALHLNYIEQAQSGVAKDKDLETRYQFILQICNDLFDRLIYKLITDIISMRNVISVDGQLKPNADGIIIVKPTQFQINTALDLLNLYDASTKAQMPDFIRAKQLEDYADKQYGGDDILKKKTCIIPQLDPIALKTESEKQIILTNVGGTDLWFRSLNIPLIIDQIIREKSGEWFLNASFDVIKSEVERIYLTIPVPEKPEVKTIDQNKV